MVSIACTARCAFRIGVSDQREKPGRDDLPGQAELVDEPAAAALGGAGGEEARPERVDFCLVVARHEQRHRGRQPVRRAAVERDVALAGDLEARAGRARAGDLGGGEDLAVQPGGVVGGVVEPERIGSASPAAPISRCARTCWSSRTRPRSAIRRRGCGARPPPRCGRCGSGSRRPSGCCSPATACRAPRPRSAAATCARPTTSPSRSLDYAGAGGHAAVSVQHVIAARKDLWP